jgi:hypothetical protein
LHATFAGGWAACLRASARGRTGGAAFSAGWNLAGLTGQPFIIRGLTGDTGGCDEGQEA